MDGILGDLLAFLRESPSVRGLVVSRGADERSFLTDYLSSPRHALPVPPRRREPLEVRLRSCDRCGGALEKKGAAGSGENGVMVILNPPARLSGSERRAQRRDSAELLKKMLGAIGIDAARCRITPMIKCESGGRSPGQMFSACEEFLEEEIGAMRPRVIIVMGDIIPLKRIIAAFQGIPFFSIDHPVALLNNPELKRGAWSTLKHVRARLDEIEAGNTRAR